MGQFFTLLQSALDAIKVDDSRVRSFRLTYLEDGRPSIRFGLYCGKSIVWVDGHRPSIRCFVMEWETRGERDDLVKDLHRRRQMTQVEIGRLVGISQKTVSNVLRSAD